MRVAGVIVLGIVLAGCTTEQSLPAPTTTASARTGELSVFVCLETCPSGVTGADVFVDDPAAIANATSLDSVVGLPPAVAVTGAGGKATVNVTIPGTYVLEALGPRGYTMERGPHLVLDENTTRLTADIPIYRGQIAGQRNATWSATLMPPSEPRVVPVPFAFSDDAGIQIAYQDRLIDMHIRVEWDETLGSSPELVPCVGVAGQPRMIVGEPDDSAGRQGASLTPSSQELQELKDSLALGKTLQVCLTVLEEQATMEDVQASLQLNFGFLGKNTRGIIY